MRFFEKLVVAYFLGHPVYVITRRMQAIWKLKKEECLLHACRFEQATSAISLRYWCSKNLRYTDSTQLTTTNLAYGVAT